MGNARLVNEPAFDTASVAWCRVAEPQIDRHDSLGVAQQSDLAATGATGTGEPGASEGRQSTPDDAAPDRPRRRGEITEYAFMDDVVLYSPDQQTAFALNSSARMVWERCDGEHTVTQICEDLSLLCGHSGAGLFPDVAGALAQLRALAILEPPETRVGQLL